MVEQRERRALLLTCLLNNNNKLPAIMVVHNLLDFLKKTRHKLAVQKGEDVLLQAWAGHGPAKASSLAGVANTTWPERIPLTSRNGAPMCSPDESIS